MSYAGLGTDLKALVIFHGHGCAWYQQFLRPNFRHCLIAIEAEDGWVEIDGKEGAPTVKIQPAETGADLAAFYRGLGLIVVETETGGPVFWPLMGRNCVGVVKAFCGIWEPWIWTPRQLYKRLERTSHALEQVQPDGIRANAGDGVPV